MFAGQFHPDPLIETNVNPAGTVSVSVTVVPLPNDVSDGFETTTV